MKVVLPKSASVRGFTLVELLIAISVIAILSTIGFMVYSQSQKLARDTKRKEDLRQIQQALRLYYQDFNAYPTATSWVNSGSGGTWISGLNNNYIDRLPQDPLNSCASGSVQTSATCYRYGYFTLSSGSAGCPAANQHFVLAANLENVNDPLADRQMNYTLCDGTTFHDSIFIVANNS